MPVWKQEVNDRFQNSKDGYRDISMLVNVDGVIGEVLWLVVAKLPPPPNRKASLDKLPLPPSVRKGESA